MRRRRIRHRPDANQQEIIDFALSVGATVDVIGDPVDLLVGFRGRNLLWEVKAGQKKALTEQQVEFFQKWHGRVERINSVDDAAASLGVVVRRG